MFTGTSFWCVGGQHTLEALRQVKETRAARGDPVDLSWLTHVKAIRIIRFGAPMDQVQLAAGDHQAQQSGVRNLTIGEFIRILVREPSDLPTRLCILRAVQKAGWSKEAGAV